MNLSRYTHESSVFLSDPKVTNIFLSNPKVTNDVYPLTKKNTHTQANNMHASHMYALT